MTKKSSDWAPWDETRARYPVDDELYANARAQIDAEITGYQLAQLRKELGVTQTQLGGHVRIVADLGDRTVDLRGWDATAA